MLVEQQNLDLQKKQAGASKKLRVVALGVRGFQPLSGPPSVLNARSLVQFFLAVN